jgi:hypothetical protein
MIRARVGQVTESHQINKRRGSSVNCITPPLMIIARIVIGLQPGFKNRQCIYFDVNTPSLLPNGYARSLSPVVQ